MREILFRGRDAVGWHYGFYYTVKDLDRKDIPTIDGVPVIPETVGEYTGMKDRNGKKIFEGDVVQIIYNTKLPNLDPTDVVVWDRHFRLQNRRLTMDLYDREWLKVIGNIHDRNPDLMRRIRERNGKQ